MRSALAVITLALATAATGAWAQSSAPAAASAPASGASAPRDSHVEARITALHSQLKITKDEEDQWAKVADAMRDNARTMHDLFEARSSNVGHETAIDNLKSWGDIAQAHADGNKALIAAFQPLYDSMPDAQKKIADQVFRGASAPHRARKPSSGE
ncbi:Spy/CpxP family protein refolding chaperone [Paraburkholderia phosphatilytica]|uniref:Spy/CpxP family protein refolding chaperone n=1 Tax=Paraburkholderia phosphatilytica TaxID=2282883 RepID=UPI000E4EB59C|nr:Spy/CpxP family protein refolding chaperone [Paraburkholderia phosphatilytica]